MDTPADAEVQELENLVEEIAFSLGIAPDVWARFKQQLAKLEKHHLPTYLHSLRVGIYSYGLAKLEALPDKKLPFLGALAHDIGKCTVSSDILNAGTLTEEEFGQIKRHPQAGFEILKKEFLFSGFIAGLHHFHKEGGYGIDLSFVSPFSLGGEVRAVIEHTARLVMIADFFDALTTRDNDKGLVEDNTDIKQIHDVMISYFNSSHSRIEWLITNRL